MYFSHSRVFVQTAFFVIPFFISYFLMPSKGITIEIQFMLLGIYIYMFLALLGVILTLSWAQNVFVLTKK